MEPIKTVEELARSFRKLPGVGSKTAERLAYATLHLTKEEKERFILALTDARDKVTKCPRCGFFYEERCPLCSDPTRDRKTLLVVSDSKDILAIEKTKSFHGLYFTLDGLLSPLKNRTAEAIGVDRLVERVREEKVEEVILALGTDMEGETTRLYLSSVLAPLSVKVSRLAYGIPVGTHLEYLDNLTIAQSIQFRVGMDKGEDHHG